jgi:hypothetical protein
MPIEADTRPAQSAERATSRLNTWTPVLLVILNAVKNLVLHHLSTTFLQVITLPKERGNIPVEDEILHCVQNDKEGASSQQFNSMHSHLILHCDQNDNEGLWVQISGTWTVVAVGNT